MKTLFFQLAMMGALIGSRATAAEPPITFTVDPEEGGAVIYAPMGALNATTPPTGRLWFKVLITNQSASALTLTNIRVSMTGLDVSIPRNRSCAANQTTTSSLAHIPGVTNEIITVPHPAPGMVTFRLYFTNFDTPNTLVRPLAPYAPATPGGKYFFPADEGDIGPDEYFSDGQAHDPRAQLWGADWKVYRVISRGSNSVVRAGSSGDANEDHLGWGVPIRAIADGVVLRTSTGWVNSPAPDFRAMQVMGAVDGEDIDDVKVATLSTTRAASLAILSANTVQLTVWDLGPQSRVITRRGSSAIVPGEFATHAALVALSETQLVSSVRLTDGAHRLIVWNVSTNGQDVTRVRQTNDVTVSEVALAKLTSGLVASAVRDSTGGLRVALFDVDGQIVRRDVESAGEATLINVTTLDDDRFATSMRTAQGALKVIVWDTAGNGFLLSRRGESVGENISLLATAQNQNEKWVTAYRSSPGNLLKLTRWSVLPNGDPSPELLGTNQSIQSGALAVAPAAGDSGSAVLAVTASLVTGNVFQMEGWDGNPTNSYELKAYGSDNAASRLSLSQTDGLYLFAGARTSGGQLRITTWTWADGGGNSVIMLHGDCRVLYAHFMAGSVNTNVLYPGANVAAGQVIGRMGHSGASSGPHLHINSDRIFPLTSIENMIALEAANALPRIGARPMPYSSARAMELDQISRGGEGHPGNSFATLNGQGMYNVSLGIRPSLNTVYVDRTSVVQGPNGRKESVPLMMPPGGPYPIVSFAVGAPAGTRLYIRGGNYNQAITFSTPMTVRRYDYYDADPSVIIGQ